MFFPFFTVFCLASLYCVQPRPSSIDSSSEDQDPLESNSESDAALKRLPNALIIGAKKSGTRALLEFLKLHPDIQAPGPEIHFFDRKFDRGYEWYRQKMPVTFSDQITMEKTPAYFINPQAPARIRAMNPKIKIILVVRNPVTRSISDYTQSLERKGPSIGTFQSHAILANGSINSNWTALKVGLYANHLARWLDHFPSNQIHVVSGEKLIDQPGKVLLDAQEFLGLDPLITHRHFYFNSTKGFPCVKKHWQSGRPHCLGRNKGRHHTRPSVELANKLREFYRLPNEKFYELTGQNFGWDQQSLHNHHQLRRPSPAERPSGSL